MTAFPEQLLRMGLLKVAAADFPGGNLGGDRQNRNAAAVRIAVRRAELQALALRLGASPATWSTLEALRAHRVNLALPQMRLLTTPTGPGESAGH